MSPVATDGDGVKVTEDPHPGDVQSCASDGDEYLPRFDAASHPHAVHGGDRESDAGSRRFRGVSVMDLFASVARTGYAASSEAHDNDDDDDDDDCVKLPPPRQTGRQTRPMRSSTTTARPVRF